MEPGVGLSHPCHPDREPPGERHRDDHSPDRTADAYDGGPGQGEAEPVARPGADGSEGADVAGRLPARSGHGLPDDDEDDQTDDKGGNTERDRQRLHGVADLLRRRRFVRDEDRCDPRQVLPLAESFDCRGQRAEIGARLRIDERPLEVPPRAVDQRRERGSGHDRTRLVEVAEGHDLVVEHPDPGDREPDGDGPPLPVATSGATSLGLAFVKSTASMWSPTWRSPATAKRLLTRISSARAASGSRPATSLGRPISEPGVPSVEASTPIPVSASAKRSDGVPASGTRGTPANSRIRRTPGVPATAA